MIRPDYRDIRIRSQFLQHSSEGSSWKNHKYIKRVDGTYYYPDSYEGGRHLPDGEKYKIMEDELFEKLKNSSDKDIGQMLSGSFDKVLLEQMGVDWTKLPKEEVDRMQRNLIDRFEEKTESNSKIDLSENDIENLAKEVIRGNFGNGQERKDLLGENYEEIQKRVNELMKGSAGSKTIPSDKTKDIGIAEEAAKRAVALVETDRNKKTK
nr:MAG TPA: peptidoglycan hydrolase [Caudoviricetes sp.]